VFKIPLLIRIPIDATFFAAPHVSLLALTVVGGTLALSPATAGDLLDFKSPLDNSPMTFPLQTGEVETSAVKNFKATGANEYRGNADAVADGKKLFAAIALFAMAPTAPERWARRWSARTSSTRKR
jgi:hypothetical protein